jgi:hypothetical protein
MKPSEIKSVLNYDALSEAENLTGKSYKEDKATEAVAMLNHIKHGEKKRMMLNKLQDSNGHNTVDEYLKIVESIGFKTILTEKFYGSLCSAEETLYIMWHDEYSILLKFDTFNGTHVNSGNFYYNVSLNQDAPFGITSSGSYVSNGDKHGTFSSMFNKDFTPHFLPEEFRLNEPAFDGDYISDKYKIEYNTWKELVKLYIDSNDLITIYSGYHDCREAIKFNIKQLSDNGTFLKYWVDMPWIWLCHYSDKSDYKRITQERITKLPEYIRKRMGFKINKVGI